jgi:hypothetical protein
VAVRRPDPRWWPSESFDGCPLRLILRERDITSVFRFLKIRGWSRSAIAAATGMSETRVRAICQARQRVTSYDVLARVADGLLIDRGLLGLAYYDSDSRGPGGSDSTALAGTSNALHLYQRSAAWHGDMYWTSAPQVLYAVAQAHTELGTWLTGRITGHGTPALAAALARSALLTARLALFDLGKPAAAGSWLAVARDAAERTGDALLVATVLGHLAFLPGFGRDPEQARSLLAAAQRVGQRAGPLLRSWLHCVASEVEARAGCGTASRHQIDRAEAALAQAHGEPVPPWLEFYDADRLDCFAGYAALIAGDRTEATARLESALAGIAETNGKQRSVVLADLAGASVPDLDRVADWLTRAVDALAVDWYETGLNRVREVLPVLRDSGHDTAVPERVRAIAAARP